MLLTLALGEVGEAGAQGAPVDVALVLAVDISLSMDGAEQRAQREGYIAALSDPAVMDAIARGRRGRIAVAYVEWGGPWTQRVVAPWTVIAGPDDAQAVIEELRFADIATSRGTSITAALDFATGLLAEAPPADRRVIDISGDGPNNMGGPVTQARDRALAAGVEVNGLPLMLGPPDPIFSVPDLDIYYQDCVVGGPLALVIPVLGVERFASAIRQKLILEIAAPAPRPPADVGTTPAAAPAAAGTDCAIGEKLYERWRRSMDWN
ncbi:Protein of unknown function [Rubrimonas cliftonensis]|uniref:VWFA domain-containing protein n=1 Tax=Rubrimonas cliftonensis TaxID=89524 RepID=A0A1H4EIM2_9RHOB|nr:Protein of unknown function [Rubrimonas cliftonensis]